MTKIRYFYRTHKSKLLKLFLVIGMTSPVGVGKLGEKTTTYCKW